MTGRLSRITSVAAACWFLPASASAVSLVIDHPNTPDVVQAGDTVSFSFAFQLDRDEALLATQAEISAPHLSDFQFSSNSGIKGPNPWDLSSTFRRISDADGDLFNPMWVHAENIFDDDPNGVTWDEVGGLAPLGSFSAIATYNGEIVFDLSSWVLSLFNGPAVPIDPTWAHYETGVTIVGGLELPLAPPPPPAAPSVAEAPALTPTPAPVVQPSLVTATSTRTVMPLRGSLMRSLTTMISGIDASGAIVSICDEGHAESCTRAFYPAAFSSPQLHVSATAELAGAVPEPSMTLLLLLASSVLVLKRRSR